MRAFLSQLVELNVQVTQGKSEEDCFRRISFFFVEIFKFVVVVFFLHF